MFIVYDYSEPQKMKFYDGAWHSDTRTPSGEAVHPPSGAPASIKIFEINIMIIIMWISEIWMEAGAPMEGPEPPQKVYECQNG